MRTTTQLAQVPMGGGALTAEASQDRDGTTCRRFSAAEIGTLDDATAERSCFGGRHPLPGNRAGGGFAADLGIREGNSAAHSAVVRLPHAACPS